MSTRPTPSSPGPTQPTAPRHEQASPPPTEPGLRRLIVLGSTGSIGRNTLDVVRRFNAQPGLEQRFEVAGLAAGRNAELLIEQARDLATPAVAIADESAAETVRKELPAVNVFSGLDSARRLVEAVEATDALAAVVGVAGLAGTLAAIRKGMRVSLANKETLVAAGALVGPLVRHHGAELIPVDSEHSAVFQCLAGEPDKTVKRIVLTASGGPFRTVEADVMAQASIEQALKHPTWKMGQKITIDSATMMNKALEVIEAHWLFGLPAERINVIVHPQSVVHSFVEFEDHSVLAQLGSPDMRMPIQYALSYPHRRPGCGQAMDWTQLSRLDFEPPDPKKFPSLSMAYEVIDAGGTAGAVFNAANEAAVEAFLARRIAFGRIFELVAEALAAADGGPAERLEDVLEADRRAREFVDQRLKSRPG